MIDPWLEDQIVERLAAFAAGQIGFSEQAIRPDAIRRVLREELRRGNGSLDGLVQKLQEKDGPLLAAVRAAVLVGETYFFRQVEHFEFLVTRVIPQLALRDRPIRAWSAGCSTGEEAYSLAACLLGAGPHVRAEVVGTDISPASLQVARAGVYSRWSSRETAPPLYPVHTPHSPDRLKVLEEVAALTHFLEHNLLEPARPTLGEFQIIFCRNVLSYFSAPAARIAVGHLADALAPGGYAFFGTMDVGRTPPGLEEVPSRGLQIFRKPEPAAPAVRPPPPPPATAPEPATPAAGLAAAIPEAGRPAAEREAKEALGTLRERAREHEHACVDLHVRALSRIERGQRAAAAQDLSELRRRAPDYLPGLLELALLDLRDGRRGPAEELMREILWRSEGRAPDELCPGPEPLPVSYYRTAARALLTGPVQADRSRPAHGAGGGGEP